jgi:predicted RNA-binding protein
MCETNAFLRGNGAEEMLLESLSKIEVKGDSLQLSNIFGDRKEIKGRILEINFQGGRVLIERL